MHTSSQSASAPTPGKKPKGLQRFVPFGCGGLLVIGLIAFVWSTCHRDSAIYESGTGFLDALRRGNVGSAYPMLSARRRAVLSRDAFDALTQHPAFRARGEASLGTLEQRHPGYCTSWDLDVGGEAWNLQIFMLEEDDGYRVHSFALQAPATVQLSNLLTECGFQEGTQVGYRGPPIERATPPTGF